MWYVVQTLSGREKEMLSLLHARDADHLLKESLVPQRELMRKRKGEWTKFSETLFPGYAFVRTESPGGVNKLLGALPFFARVLGTDEGFTPLSDRDKLQMQRVMDADTHVVRMSTGVIEGDQVTVLSGPLRGIEGLITKINRHKRTAQLQIELLGRLVKVTTGLEIIHKS